MIWESRARSKIANNAFRALSIALAITIASLNGENEINQFFEKLIFMLYIL